MFVPKFMMLCFTLTAVLLSAMFLSITVLHQALPTAVSRLTPPQSLTVITLIYTQVKEHKFVEHNCVMISRTRHRFIIFTDDLSQQYCRVCECRMYRKAKCPCPRKSCGRKNPCEKLQFFINVVKEFGEMVFLDSDLLIIKNSFLDRLQARSQAHDFLATYGHRGMESHGYYNSFNSGLLFIRKLAGVNYDDLMKRLYEAGGLRDQAIISTFIQKWYKNWDTLSWKWHCRALKEMKQDIPFSECYTVHDRQEAEIVFNALNVSKLTIA